MSGRGVKEEKTLIFGYVKGTKTPVGLALNAAGEIEVVFNPTDVIQIQDQGQIISDEATVTLTNMTGTGAHVLDKDATTEVVVTDPTAVAQIRVTLNQAMFLPEISIRPGASGDLSRDIIITVEDIYGVGHPIYIREGTGVFGDGVDTKPFSSILARAVVIDFGASGLGTTYDVSQVVIYKAIGKQDTAQSPAHVYTEQQITLDDIASIVLIPAGAGVFDGEVNSLFDKDGTTFLTYDGAAFPMEIDINFKKPETVNKAALLSVANPMVGARVEIVRTDGTTEAIHQVGAGVAEFSIDEPKFSPFLAVGMILTFDGPPATIMDIGEIIVQKVIDTQASLDRNADTIVPLLTAVTVTNGTPIAGDPAAPAVGVDISGGPNPAMAGSGALMDKNNNQAISAQIIIDAAAGVTTITISVDWYYSDDNVTFHYGGTFPIFDSTAVFAGNPNPTGFQAAGGVAYWMINHGIDSFNKYIALAIRNDDAVNDVDVSAAIVKQR